MIEKDSFFVKSFCGRTAIPGEQNFSCFHCLFPCNTPHEIQLSCGQISHGGCFRERQYLNCLGCSPESAKNPDKENYRKRENSTKVLFFCWSICYYLSEIQKNGKKEENTTEITDLGRSPKKISSISCTYSNGKRTRTKSKKVW